MSDLFANLVQMAHGEPALVRPLLGPRYGAPLPLANDDTPPARETAGLPELALPPLIAPDDPRARQPLATLRQMRLTAAADPVDADTGALQPPAAVATKGAAAWPDGGAADDSRQRPALPTTPEPLRAPSSSAWPAGQLHSPSAGAREVLGAETDLAAAPRPITDEPPGESQPMPVRPTGQIDSLPAVVDSWDHAHRASSSISPLMETPATPCGTPPAML